MQRKFRFVMVSIVLLVLGLLIGPAGGRRRSLSAGERATRSQR